MVFNLAAAALIVQENNVTSFVTYTQFALSATQLALHCLLLISLFSFIIKEKQLLLLPLCLHYVVNIVYSSCIIDYYVNKEQYNEQFFKFSIAIIVINAIALCCSLTVVRSTQNS